MDAGLRLGRADGLGHLLVVHSAVQASSSGERRGGGGPSCQGSSFAAEGLCCTWFFVSYLRIALRAAWPHLCCYSQGSSLGRLFADKSFLHSLVNQIQFDRMRQVGFGMCLLCLRLGRWLLRFRFLQVGWPLACLSHNVLGVRARPAPSVDTSAEAADEAAWGALFCSVFCT